MTIKKFTEACADEITGLLSGAAQHACDTNNHGLFVNELIEQDNDPGSRSGTERALGPKLYAELQKIKSGTDLDGPADGDPDAVVW